MLEEHVRTQTFLGCFPASLNIIKLFLYFLKDSELLQWTLISKCALKQIYLQGYWHSCDHTPGPQAPKIIPVCVNSTWRSTGEIKPFLQNTGCEQYQKNCLQASLINFRHKHLIISLVLLINIIQAKENNCNQLTKGLSFYYWLTRPFNPWFELLDEGNWAKLFNKFPIPIYLTALNINNISISTPSFSK